MKIENIIIIIIKHLEIDQIMAGVDMLLNKPKQTVPCP